MTFQRSEARLLEAKSKDIGMIADQLGVIGLVPWPARPGMESVGPCPQCGGRDRFSINTNKRVFNCRRCLARGDVISLVQFVRGCSLPEALTWILGAEVDARPEERRARAEAAALNHKRNEARARRAREREIKSAGELWRSAKETPRTAVADYLAARGITRDLLPELPKCLRYSADLPYLVRATAGWREVHRGPAMLAVVQAPDGRGIGCHRTWFDLSAPAAKCVITDPASGEALVRKKMRGSKRGGAIRLLTPIGAWDTLVMGEGIETTLTGLVAAQHAGLYPDAAWWAGVDLGNISGRRQSGKGLKFAGLPDLSDTEAFLPPPWVRHLVLIEDGDSDPRDTRAKLEAGARRAMAKIPGLSASIVRCPAGRDLNDILLEAISQ